MAFELTFEVMGDVQLQRSFSRFTEDIKDFTPALEDIYQDFLEGERKQFESEGNTGSGGWAPLSPAYAAWKAQNFPGAPIMVRTGLLKESLLGNNPWSVKDIQPLGATFGTRIPYAAYHQTGTRKMPARPLVQLTEDQKTRWTKIIHRWLVEKVKQDVGDMATYHEAME